METETVLIANTHSKNRALVDKIHKRITGYIRAKTSVLLTYNIETKHVAAATVITPGAESPTMMPLADPAWVSISVLLNKGEVSEVLDRLEELGAKSLLVVDVNNCRI